MADSKTSALTSLAGGDVDTTADVIEIVDTSVTTSKKITIDELVIAMDVGDAAWSIVTSDPGPAVASSRYMANTTSAAFTVTLPAAPAANAKIVIADYAGTWGIKALTVGCNTKKINGIAEDMVCNTNWDQVTLEYIDVTRGWAVL